ncbi:SLOG family protein [Nocardia sp. NRRL S-836]|uniref:SLOG family protein n=1 Tax=Nocardia sp. NRRL S-836 TaxID=1519492 RepID=UPI0018D0F7EE
MGLRILITGSRTWADRAMIRAALAEVWNPDSVLVSGACPNGATRSARRAGAAGADDRAPSRGLRPLSPSRRVRAQRGDGQGRCGPVPGIHPRQLGGRE